MIKTPFRFLHAADLLLEQPIEWIGDGAEAIEDRLLGAPMEAAKRLFQHAVNEVVDFVILSGNVVDPNASGPGPLVFLLEQFQLLAEANIPVYWAGSERDGPEHWPAALYLPENVHFFRTGNVEEIIISKEGYPLVRLLGFSRGNRSQRLSAAEFSADASGLYTIAVANGQLEPESVRFRGIPFWALGGSARKTFRFLPESPPDFPFEKKRKVRSSSPTPPYPDSTEDRDEDHDRLPSIVHYPGTTLARSVKDSREYGATLVDVDVKGGTNLTFLTTSPFRWVEEKIELDSGASVKQLRGEMQKRILAYRSIKSRDDLMISWLIDCPGGSLPTDLRGGSVAEQLLEELRTDYGIEPPICWSVGITTTYPELTNPGIYDQKTILADFLRAIRNYQQHPYEPINLLQFLPTNYRELPFASRLSLALPPELTSEPLLKEVMYGDPGKELTPIEQIQLENTRKKIRDELRQERLRKALLKKSREKNASETKIIAEKRSEAEGKLTGSKHRPRRRREKVLKLVRVRQRLVQQLLREAAALAWDMLGSEVDKKALGLAPPNRSEQGKQR